MFLPLHGLSLLQIVLMGGFMTCWQSMSKAGTACPRSSTRVHFNSRVIIPLLQVVEH